MKSRIHIHVHSHDSVFSRTSPSKFGQLANEARSAAKHEARGAIYKVYSLSKAGARKTPVHAMNSNLTQEEANKRLAEMQRMNPNLKFEIGT